MPLLYATNENYQVYNSDIAKVGKASSFPHEQASQMPWAAEHGLETWSLSSQRQQPITSNVTNVLIDGLVNAGVCQKQSVASREPVTEGHQSLTRIFCGGSEDIKGNAHSGALPPWLEGIETRNEMSYQESLGGMVLKRIVERQTN